MTDDQTLAYTMQINTYTTAQSHNATFQKDIRDQVSMAIENHKKCRDATLASILESPHLIFKYNNTKVKIAVYV